MKKMSCLFSSRLYREGIGRVKSVGIIAAILTVLSSVSAPISSITAYFLMKSSGMAIKVEPVSASAIIRPLLLLLVFAPLMVSKTFSYLNKRNQSDFYFALPYKRITVYVSFLLGVITWALSIAVVSFALRLTLYAICPSVAVAVGSSFVALLSAIVCILMFVGIAALAMTMTGTRFSNLAVFCILLLEVRLVASAFSSCLSAVLPVFDITHSIGAYFTFANHLPFVLSLGALTGARYVSGWLIAWSAFLAVGYLVLGAVVYVKRPGEAAGAPALNRKWQHVWRLAAALPLFLSAVSALLKTVVPNEEQAFSFFSVPLLLGLSFLVYLLYELISAGHLRQFGKAAVTFTVLFALGGVFAGSVLALRGAVLARPLNRDDVASVTFYRGEEDALLGVVYGISYEELAVRDIAFDDSEIIRMVTDCYEESIDACKKGEFNAYGPVLNTLQDTYTALQVTIKTKSGATFSRILRMTDSQGEWLNTCKLNTPTYRDAYLSLPPDGTVTYINAGWYAGNATAIWASFCEEYAALTQSEKAAVKDPWANAETAAFSLTVTGEYRGNTYSGVYAIPSSCEKTVALYFSLLNRDSANNGKTNIAATAETLRQLAREGKTNSDVPICISVTLSEGGSTQTEYYLYCYTGDSAAQGAELALYQALSAQVEPFASDVAYTEGTSWMLVQIDSMGADYESTYAVALLNEETLAQLQLLLEEVCKEG